MAKSVALSVVRTDDLCGALLALDQAVATAEHPDLYDLAQCGETCAAAAGALRSCSRALGTVARGSVVKVTGGAPLL